MYHVGWHVRIFNKMATCMHLVIVTIATAMAADVMRQRCFSVWRGPRRQMGEGGCHVGIVHMSWTGKPFVWDKGIYLTRKPRWNVHSLFLFLVMRSVTDVLRVQSRFVKFGGGGGGEAAGRTPYTFNKPTLGPKYVSNRPNITNLSRRQL